MRMGLILGLALVGTALSAAGPDDWAKPFPGVVQDEHNVRGFVGDYRWLSNFLPCRVEYEGLVYLSSEAAYQASKLTPPERAVFTQLDPDSAKHRAHASKFDAAAWDARKVRVMREVLWAKFSQHPELAQKLLATGDKYLEETNQWNDPYWGVYQGKGENVLGKLLMETRTRLRTVAPHP